MSIWIFNSYSALPCFIIFLTQLTLLTAELSVYPDFAGMFGGKILDVSGPFFSSGQDIYCKFQDLDKLTPPVENKAIFVNSTRIRCIVPRLFIRDHVSLSISVDNKATYQYSAIITIVFPGRMPKSEHVTAVASRTERGWYSSNPKSLTLKWNKELLSNNSNDKVNISLIGYKENDGMPTYKYLKCLGHDIPVGNGHYELNPLEYQCSGQDCFDYELGLLEVRLKDEYKPQTYRNGAGNQCCYGTSGLLVFTADTYFGSTPDKTHDWGAAPYGKPGYVPLLSHWVLDIVQLHYCCVWDNYNSCDYYMELRPTTDCTGYNPPVPASVFGQGHVMSFGGSSYRILGPGDFVLFRAGNTEIQARFQPNLYKPSDSKMEIKTTYSLTAVAVQDIRTSDRVELRLTEQTSHTKDKHIDVRVNSQHVHFDGGALMWQDFRGVAVVLTGDKSEQSNFTVLLTNGIGFQVAEISHTLQLDVLLPTDTITDVSGLFGSLYGTFSLPDETPFNINTNNEVLYNNFQRYWAVNESGKLFSDFLSANHSLSGQTNLYPIPVDGFDSKSINCMIAPGVISKECNFDFSHTGSRELANATRTAVMRHTALRNNLKPVRSCGLLNVPGAKKTNYDYTIGTTTTLTECRSGPLSGTRTYTCEATSNETQAWFPDVSATCEIPPKAANLWMIIGLSVACTVVVVVAIVVIICLVKKRRTRNRRPPGDKHETETQKMETSRDNNEL